MTTLSVFPDERILKDIKAFCKKYNIRIEDFFQILNDQKVTPMLRGKAAEYGVAYALQQILPQKNWIVNKLNLNPQPGSLDKGIRITHTRTENTFVVETKSGDRDTMRLGTRSKLVKVPHFKVKCHRSRSNKDRSYNDLYLASDFDILIATPLNALYKGGTVSEEFELVSEEGLLETLYWHYGVTDEESLIEAASKDWRFVVSEAIAVVDNNGNRVIPRTPLVWLDNDPNWLPLNQIEPALEAIVRERRVQQARRS